METKEKKSEELKTYEAIQSLKINAGTKVDNNLVVATILTELCNLIKEQNNILKAGLRVYSYD